MTLILKMAALYSFELSIIQTSVTLLPFLQFSLGLWSWADLEGGQGSRPPPPPLKNHKNIGFLNNTGPEPLRNYKATKPAFNV